MTDRATFGEHLALYISAYSVSRMEIGHPMTDVEILSALIAMAANVLTQGPPGDYRAAVLKATHQSLDALCEESPDRESEVY